MANSQVNIKFCGLTRREDVEKAISLGADFAGFIFAPKSKRYISAETAGLITQNLNFETTRKIGVFVNASREEILEVNNKFKLDAVQLHGEETSDFADSLGLPYWKALRIKDEADLKQIRSYPNAQALLLDTWDEKLQGGTGKTFGIELARRALADYTEVKLIIAGGLNPENLTDYARLKPWAVDINSGVEISPGVKDSQRMATAVSLITSA